MDEAIPAPPPALIDLLGQRDHVKIVVPFSTQVAELSEDDEDAPPPPIDALLILVSTVADDTETSALLLWNISKSQALIALPMVSSILDVTSKSPTHICITAPRAAACIRGSSPNVLLLQDLRLLLNQPGTSRPASDQLLLTRWTWLKRYCTPEAFATVKRVLKDGQEREKQPIWGQFATKSTTAGAAKVEGKPAASADDVKLAIVTYNVGGARPPTDPQELTFLARQSVREADLLAVGLQEVDQSSSAYVWFDPARQAAWIHAINEHLRRANDEDGEGRWELRAVKQHVTILLLVYARRVAVDDMAVASVGVGLGGFMANKGGVGVRMRVRADGREATVCFVTAHLSAGAGRIAMERRVWDWAEIERRLEFEMPVGGEEKSDSSSSGSDDDEAATIKIPLRDHDYIILFGDLNSRLPLTLSSYQVQRLLRRGKAGAQMLQGYDELKAHLRDAALTNVTPIDETSALAVQSWRGWKEAELAFPPTYKFDVGTSRYDTSEKQRVPSWTDRVLVHAATPRSWTIDEYDCQADVNLSDHKPVYAIISLHLDARSPA